MVWIDRIYYRNYSFKKYTNFRNLWAQKPRDILVKTFLTEIPGNISGFTKKVLFDL